MNVQIREVYSDEYAAGKVISSTPPPVRASRRATASC
ncbi:MAG: hypothetical protein ACLUIX_10790 [Oscillospiraceae bacterium]